MAQIVGVFRIGRDVEVRYTQGGEPVASLSLAYAYGRKGDDGKKPTQWIDAKLWGKRAEAMSQYLRKGGLVYCVISDPHIETFTKNDGSSSFKLSGSVSEIEFAGGNDSQQSGGQERQQAPQRSQQPEQRSSQGAPPNKARFDDLGDDIPFNPHAKGRIGHCM